MAAFQHADCLIPSGIMWIGIGFGVFVMNPMITCPVNDAVLECHCVENGQQNSQRKLSFV